MSLPDLDTALQHIAARPELGHFFGPRSEAEILAAEEMLGWPLPVAYRRFVQLHGAGSFGGFEAYGVVPGNPPAVPNAVWRTLELREGGWLKSNQIFIADTGWGDHYCIELEASAVPVVIVPIGGGQSERIHEDFGSFLLEKVRGQD